MKKVAICISLSIIMIACDKVTVRPTDANFFYGGNEYPDMDDMRSYDMRPALSCAAAKGLAGDNLLCVDFSKFVDSFPLPPSKLPGWDLTSQCSAGWCVNGGKLQVNIVNYPTFTGTCNLTMPAVSATEYQQYDSFTLSLIHRVDISPTVPQNIQVMLGIDDPFNRLVTQWTGRQARQTSTMTVKKADLPNGLTGMYQPLLKLSAPQAAGGAYTGWQIESIAVMGNP